MMFQYLLLQKYEKLQKIMIVQNTSPLETSQTGHAATQDRVRILKTTRIIQNLNQHNASSQYLIILLLDPFCYLAI